MLFLILRTYVRAYVHAYVHMHTCIRAQVYTCTHVHMYTCTRARAHGYKYTPMPCLRSHHRSYSILPVLPNIVYLSLSKDIYIYDISIYLHGVNHLLLLCIMEGFRVLGLGKFLSSISFQVLFFIVT